MTDFRDPYSPILQALKAGQTDLATRLVDALLRRQPADARAHALNARVLAAAGDAGGATAAADRALRLDPNFVPAHIERAALARAAKDHARAAEHLQQVVNLAPGLAEGWFDFGVALEALDRPVDAERAFGEASRLQPGRFETWIKLGRYAYARDAHDDALALFGRAAEVAPNALEAWLNLGETFLRLDRVKGAVTAFERATTLAPDSLHAWDGRVRALNASKALPAEMVVARRGLALAAKTAEAYVFLAMQCVRNGKLDEARAAYEDALALDPDYLPARWGRFLYPVSEVFDDDARATFRREWLAGLADFESRWHDGVDAATATSCVTMATNFYLHYLGEPFVEEQRRFGALLERMMRTLVPAGDVPARARDGRRRIGLLTAFIRPHTIMKLFETVITGLDRDVFEISLFHPDNTRSELSERLAQSVDFYAHGENSLDWWVETVRARDLDVLLYIDIGMHPIAQGVSAVRLAPVQAALWGHPVTTGLTTIDYFLTADAMEAPDGQRNYTETLVRLPRLGTCYRPPTTTPEVPDELRDPPPGRLNYFFGQSAFKIMPRHDAVFARLVAALPEVLINMTPHPNPFTRAALRERMSRTFAAHGLAFEDVIGTFRYVKEPEFLGIASRCAVNLDSLDWSGGNTTLEILWHDVPTVTLPGPLMRSRHTCAMLTLLELDELIASDLDDYLRIAIELGRSADWRAELSGRIRERKHRLYEDRAVVDAIGAFLRDPAASLRA